MEMEDHHHHHHQYGMPDLRQLLNGRPTHHFQPISQPPETLFSSGHHRNLPPPQPHHHHHFDMMQMMPRGLHHHEFPCDSTANNATNPTAAAAAVGTTVTSASTPTASTCGGFDGETTAAFCGGDGGNGRWPRQETLTLLEIRSRLDPKFKEANQKGPLWDEVSRIMSEEHGYQRSGKKCREKFENLYKYYKKTKEGKAGRQDGKHYRFFRQLEALYGETSNNSVSGLVGNNFQFHGTPNTNTDQEKHHQEVYHTLKLCDNSLSLSNSSEFDTSSSDDNDLSTAAAATATAAMAMENDSSEKRGKKKRGNSSSSSSRSWKVKIKEFIDSQMRKLVDRQEAWLEKLTKTLEQKEQERVLREEEWRKEEAARIDREHKFWAKERAWIEARDAALMESLQNLTGNKQMQINHSENQNENNVKQADGWGESEISRLIQLRSSMESRFQGESGCSEEILWEEIGAKMGCLGFERSGLMCKEKWDNISAYLVIKTNKESYNKKRKENSRGSSGCYYPNNVDDSGLYGQGRAYCDQGSSPSNSNAANVGVNDSCFRFLMADNGENLWENYGLKLSKGDQNQ